MISTERLMGRLRERLESGIAFVIGAYGNEWLSERIARKYLKEYSELGVGLGGATLIDLLGVRESMKGYEPYIDKVTDAFSDIGFYHTARYKLFKIPMCYFSDANTIKCINFDADVVDANNVYVSVDDRDVGVSSVEGSPSSFTIALAESVASGWHKLLVGAGSTKRDVFRGRVYTP